jgi:hypothetical protein
MKQKRICILALPIMIGILSTVHADNIVVGDVTATLGPDFFFDTAAIGGGDFNSSDAFFNRDFGVNGYDPAGTQITITGIGWASPANQVLATTATITITHLGADNAVGGGDDVVVGTVTDAIPTNTTAGERVWKFTTPMVANISGTGSRFLIRIQGDGNIRYKTTSTTAQTAADVKLSVAGSFNGGTLPDTDGDGIPDVFETNTGVFLSQASTGTDPGKADTDGDGLSDFEEIYTHGTNPNDPDMDRDGLSDGDEILVHLTNPQNRDSDNDRLSDGFEVANGLNPLANADFDGDGTPDALEVLFYNSNPKDNTSFPGDGTSPAPGSFTPIQNAGVSTQLDFQNLAPLGETLLDEAGSGGSVDADFTMGVTSFALHYDNLFPAAGSAVSLTGFAWPVVAAINTSGDILVQFFDPGPDGTRSIDQATLVGTAKGTLTVTGVTTIMYWNFPAPINFTSTGTGLIVKIQSTGALRIKAQNQGLDMFATGIWYTNDGRNTFGTLRSSRISLGGTVVAPSVPEILAITRSGTTTSLTWDLNGAPSVTLQRSTTLEPGSFMDIPSRTNTTETSYEETSSDPKAFFRLSYP